jgi:MFS family permease
MSGSNQIFQNHPRAAGALLTLLGAGFSYWMIIMPIQQAETHEASVSISAKGDMVGVMLLAAGLILLVFGHGVSRFIRPEPGESKVPAYCIGTVLALIGLGVHFWLKSYLESKGYTFGR